MRLQEEKFQCKHLNMAGRQSGSMATDFLDSVHIMVQARRKQNCIGPAYWYLYLSAYVSVYAEARWVWGHACPGKFFNAVRQV